MRGCGAVSCSLMSAIITRGWSTGNFLQVIMKIMMVRMTAVRWGGWGCFKFMRRSRMITIVCLMLIILRGWCHRRGSFRLLSEPFSASSSLFVVIVIIVLLRRRLFSQSRQTGRSDGCWSSCCNDCCGWWGQVCCGTESSPVYPEDNWILTPVS